MKIWREAMSFATTEGVSSFLDAPLETSSDKAKMIDNVQIMKLRRPNTKRLFPLFDPFTASRALAFAASFTMK